MIAHFRTMTSIPLEAFSLLGVNAKTSATAIGRFGTGLKYAISVILRHGGKVRLFVDGTEYEFYLGKLEFRDKRFQQVRMRKRHGTLARWMSSKPLPFTTEFGKDWGLWQAYRELESNTRDEGGTTTIMEEYDSIPPVGTLITVECPGLIEAIAKEEVFLDTNASRKVYSDSKVSIYDRPSRHLYYQGIRVFTLRYPARFTYDFAVGAVTLTEDRTAANSWSLMYDLASIVQTKISDRGVLYKMLNAGAKSASERNVLTFETQDLNFQYEVEGSSEFAYVAGSLADRGLGGRSVSAYRSSHTSYVSRSSNLSIALPAESWKLIAKALKEAHGIPYDCQDAVDSLVNKVEVPW